LGKSKIHSSKPRDLPVGGTVHRQDKFACLAQDKFAHDGRLMSDHIIISTDENPDAASSTRTIWDSAFNSSAPVSSGHLVTKILMNPAFLTAKNNA